MYPMYHDCDRIFTVAACLVCWLLMCLIMKVYDSRR